SELLRESARAKAGGGKPPPAFRYVVIHNCPTGVRKERMYLMRYRLLKLALVPGVLALVVIGAGCGGGSDKKSSGTLSLSVDADRFAGPTPLNTKFSAKPKDAQGQVHYRWHFDDGT